MTAFVAAGANEAVFSVDTSEIATANAQNGGLNGIAFGDPGAGIAGRVRIDSLDFWNPEASGSTGAITSNEYADASEIERLYSLLAYARSAPEPFHSSDIARLIKLFDPAVHSWLADTYLKKRKDGAAVELYIATNRDFGLTDIKVVEEEHKEGGSIFKATTNIYIDNQEFFLFDANRLRSKIELAGILIAWAHESNDFRAWVEDEQNNFGKAFVIENREATLKAIETGAEIAEIVLVAGGEMVVSVATFGLSDWVIAYDETSKGNYIAAAVTIPFVSAALVKSFRMFKKEDADNGLHLARGVDEIPGFPNGKEQYFNDNAKKWIELDFNRLKCDVNDEEAKRRLLELATDAQITGSRLKGHYLLATFEGGVVNLFKIDEPITAYRVFSSGAETPRGDFFSLEKPISRAQAKRDLALGNDCDGHFLAKAGLEYDRYVKVHTTRGKLS